MNIDKSTQPNPIEPINKVGQKRKLTALFSSTSEEWETPDAFFKSLDEEFHFDLDVCATPQNKKCQRYFDKWQDGLKQIWDGVVWCNPPYGKTIQQWIEKGYESVQSGHANLVTMLLPARTDTQYWHQFIWDDQKHSPRAGVEVRLIQGRIKFGNAKYSAPFPSAVVIFRPVNAESAVITQQPEFMETTQSGFYKRLRNKFLSLKR